jgi:hemolysin activation/secretion protein
LRNIRGIDEESIFANAWAMASVEYRYLLDLNTAVYGFYDQGFYSFINDNIVTNDSPSGFGLGINFQTKTGIFTFNYALGNQFDNPVLIRNAKISFGFRNIF